MSQKVGGNCGNDIPKFKEFFAKFEQPRNQPPVSNAGDAGKLAKLAREFSSLLSYPPKSHKFIYTHLSEAKILNKVNMMCVDFLKFKLHLEENPLEFPGCSRSLSWFPFKEIKEKSPKKEVFAFPLILKNQTFKIKKINDSYEPEHAGLLGCVCTATSPKAIDAFADTIAKDHADQEKAIFVDFGEKQRPLFSGIFL